MVWQDIVITVIIAILNYALIPQVVDGFKEKRGFVDLQTSLLTSSGLLGLAIIYLTLKLYFSAGMTFVTFSLWAMLFYQRLKYPKVDGIR